MISDLSEMTSPKLTNAVFIILILVLSGFSIVMLSRHQTDIETIGRLKGRVSTLQSNVSSLSKSLQYLNTPGLSNGMSLIGFKWLSRNVTVALHGDAAFMVHQALRNAVHLWNDGMPWGQDYNLTIPLRLVAVNGSADVKVFWANNSVLDTMYGHDAGLQIAFTHIVAVTYHTNAVTFDGSYVVVSMGLSSDEIPLNALGVTLIDNILVHEMGHVLGLGDVKTLDLNPEEMSTAYFFTCPLISSLDVYAIWYGQMHSITITGQWLPFGPTASLPQNIPFTYSSYSRFVCGV